jgi:hypothetical protein
MMLEYTMPFINFILETLAEMERGELLKLQQDHKVEGVIVTKGVTDFADIDKAKQQ